MLPGHTVQNVSIDTTGCPANLFYLIGALSLEDIQQEVRLPRPTEEVTQLVVAVDLLQLVQHRGRRSAQLP